MTAVHAVLGAVAYAAPYLYLAALAVSWVLLRPHGRRWQTVMDEFRSLDLEPNVGSAVRLLTLWLVLVLFLAPLIRPDVFRDAPSEADETDEQVTS